MALQRAKWGCSSQLEPPATAGLLWPVHHGAALWHPGPPARGFVSAWRSALPPARGTPRCAPHGDLVSAQSCLNPDMPPSVLALRGVTASAVTGWVGVRML